MYIYRAKLRKAPTQITPARVQRSPEGAASGVRSQKTRWADNMEALKKFIERTNGDTPTEGNPRAEVRFLARWVTNTIIRYKQGEVSDERARELAAVHPAIARRFTLSRMNGRWESNLAQLVDFVTAHDRLPSRSGEGEEERFLGRWLATQRMNRHQGKLEKKTERHLLLAHPMINEWVTRKDGNTLWDRRLAQLAEFIDAHGRVPDTAKDGYSPLMGWWQRQIADLTAGKMGADRLERFTAVAQDHIGAAGLLAA